MRIIVTGSEGFIGGHLVKRLEKYHEVTGYDTKIGKDIDDVTGQALSRADMVIHLAALADVTESTENPDLYWENNVVKTTNLQRRCNKWNVPMIFASSSCIHEWHMSPYGVTKKVNEETAYPDQIALRFTNVYGPGSRDSMFVPRLLNNNLDYFNDCTRDFIHVEDLVSMIVHIMENYTEKRYGNRIDLGSGTTHSIRDLVTTFRPNVPYIPTSPYELMDNSLKELHPTLKRLVKNNLKDYLGRELGAKR